MAIEFRGTTICGVAKDGIIAIAGDGQITMGQSVVFKDNAVKVRKIYNDEVICGFAGSVADAFSLSEKLEEMLKKYSGNLLRSAVEVALLWRGDKMLRKLEAMMIVANKDGMLVLSGNGEVIEPGTVCAIGSGGNFALSAAKALIAETNLSAREIAEKSLRIAGELCVFTNGNLTIEQVGARV